MKKFMVFLIALSFLFISCADSKDLKINGKIETVEPCGWIDMNSCKRDDVIYDINVGNVVLSCLTFETILVPALLTGYQLWEPVKVKANQE